MRRENNDDPLTPSIRSSKQRELSQVTVDSLHNNKAQGIISRLSNVQPQEEKQLAEIEGL